MIRVNVRGFRAVRAPASVGLLAIGLVAGTAAPVLAKTSGTWTSAGSMKDAREGHSATLLQNGLVLVAGGEVKNASSGFTIVAGAELDSP